MDEEFSEENESSEDGSSSYASSIYNDEKELEENNLQIIKENKEDMKTKEKKGETKKGTILENKESLLNELLSPIHIRDKKKSQIKDSSNKVNKYSLSSLHNEYYKVNFAQIRYFYYDFMVDTFVEKHDYEKIPLIEKLVNECKKNNNISDSAISLNISNKELSFSKYAPLKDNSKKESGFRRHHSKYKNSKIKIMNGNGQNDEEKNAKENKSKKILNDNEIDLEKRIRESLNQEDKQKPILIFSITFPLLLFNAFSHLMAFNSSFSLFSLESAFLFSFSFLNSDK